MTAKTFLRTVFNNGKAIIAGIFMMILFCTTTGCQSSEKNPEPPSNAQASFQCDVNQAFNFQKSDPVDTESIKKQMQDIQADINDLQDKITSRQNDLKALQDAQQNSEDITRLESQIKDLQAEIAALQNQLKGLQDQLKTLQNAGKSEEIQNIEKEIKDLQNQLSSLKNNLNELQQALDHPGNVEDQGVVGHLEYLKIGSTLLKADFTVVDPLAASQSKKVVGVMNSIHWNGGYSDPITFSCQVSGANKVTLAQMLHQSQSDTSVEFMFSIYDFDPKTKTYYKSFHTNSAHLQGLIQKAGGDLMMDISMDQSTEVTSPKNYTFSLGVMPIDREMEVYMGVSSSDEWTKSWGIKVAI